MTMNVLETVRKMMGWCPNANPVMNKYARTVDFAHVSLEPPGKTNFEKFQSKNVIFSSNKILFTFCLVICLNLILLPARNLDYATLVPIIAVIYSLLYFIAARMFKAHISIDENGVLLRNFSLRDVVLNYNHIKFIRTYIISSHPIILIAAALLILVSLLIYSMMSGEWKLIVSVAPIFPLYLLLTHRQEREYHNLDTQLYIKYEDKNRHKRWHELNSTNYYSIITDETTASRIQAAIEHYRGAN